MCNISQHCRTSRKGCVHKSVLFTFTINAFYQATAEAKETEQIKKLHNLMHRFLFVLCFVFNPNKQKPNQNNQ